MEGREAEGSGVAPWGQLDPREAALWMGKAAWWERESVGVGASSCQAAPGKINQGKEEGGRV